MPEFSDLSPAYAWSPPGPPAIEAVLLGHLPGYASPWLSQYADEMAARHGGAALLRLGDREIEIEEFGAPGGPPSPPPPARARSDPGDLFATLSALRERVGAWLVVLGEVGGGMDRDRLGDVDRWTILSGVDDAAVVGAYRMLKLLLTGGPLPPPPRGVGVVFMGCDQEQAEDAADRLGRTAEAALGAEVELAGVRRRIAPVRRRRVGRFGFGSEHPWPRLRRFFTELAAAPAPRSARDSRPASGPAETAPEADETPPPLSEEELAALHEGDDPAGEAHPKQTARPADLHTNPFGPAATSETGGETREHQVEPEPLSRGPGPTHETNDTVDLAGYLPDAEAIPPRCPRHPSVQLARDRAGRFHLMRWASGGESVNAAIRELLEARSWASEHHELLSMASRAPGESARAAAITEPTAHLFTQHPRDALELACAGLPVRRPLRLHLLKPPGAADANRLIHEELI